MGNQRDTRALENQSVFPPSFSLRLVVTPFISFHIHISSDFCLKACWQLFPIQSTDQINPKKLEKTKSWCDKFLTTINNFLSAVSSATLGSPWAAKRVRRVSRGWQTTVAEQAAKPPHTKWTPAVWLSYAVVLWTTSVRNSKLANCKAHIHHYVKSCG